MPVHQGPSALVTRTIAPTIHSSLSCSLIGLFTAKGAARTSCPFETPNENSSPFGSPCTNRRSRCGWRCPYHRGRRRRGRSHSEPHPPSRRRLKASPPTMVSLPLSPKLPPFPLGITVVAEGVETSKQVTQLRRLGCNLAQGVYFSERLTSGAASMFLAAAFGYPGDRKAD
jgi:hypothetical protein